MIAFSLKKKVVCLFLILIFLYFSLRVTENYRQPNKKDENLLKQCYAINVINYMKRYYKDTETIEDKDSVLYLTPKDKIENYKDIPIPNCDWMSYVCVDKATRGKGLGKKLVKKALEKSKKRGFSNIALAVKRNNLAARNLYKKFGFRKFNGIEYKSPDGEINDVFYLTFR